MVVSVHRLASRAGAQMMKAGGNAVDAAVAVGFALAVVYPEAGNLGGGGFMLIRTADGKIRFIDYREKAPAAATANMYLDAKGNVIEEASTVGYKAIGVPGSVAGMVYAEAEVRQAVPGAGHGSGHQAGAGRIRPGCRGRQRFAEMKMRRYLPGSRNRSVSFSATGITTRPASYSSSLTWRARCSASPASPTTSTTVRWRASWRPRCKKAAA